MITICNMIWELDFWLKMWSWYKNNYIFFLKNEKNLRKINTESIFLTGKQNFAMLIWNLSKINVFFQNERKLVVSMGHFNIISMQQIFPIWNRCEKFIIQHFCYWKFLWANIIKFVSSLAHDLWSLETTMKTAHNRSPKTISHQHACTFK